MEERNDRDVISRHPSRLTKSGKGIYIQDNEVVYVASVKSVKALLKGEREVVYFAKFPYRKIVGGENERDTIVMFCEKCGRMCVWRKVGEDTWKCSVCGSESSTEGLIRKLRSIAEGY